jgi:hypothetical protein
MHLESKLRKEREYLPFMTIGESQVERKKLLTGKPYPPSSFRSNDVGIMRASATEVSRAVFSRFFT